MGLYVAYGMRDEAESGEAHFIEHLVANEPSALQGGPPRPKTATFFASNAMTKMNHTVFFTTVDPPTVENQIWQRLARLGLRREQAEVFRNERGRVLDELERDRRWGPWAAYKALTMRALGWSPELDDELASVRKTNEAAMRERVTAAYRPGRAVLVVAGDIDLDETAAAVARAAAATGFDKPAAAAPRMARKLVFDAPPTMLAQNPEGTFAAVAWRQPDHRHDDELAFLVLDQLLLGGRPDGAADKVARSDASPVGRALGARLGAAKLWDGRGDQSGVPAFAEGDPALYAVVFELPKGTTPRAVRSGVAAALKDVRVHDLTDAAIVGARQDLARFYSAWLLEPSYRVLGDHLATLAREGRDPAEVAGLPMRVQRVEPAAVRRAFQQLTRRPPMIAVVGPETRAD